MHKRRAERLVCFVYILLYVVRHSQLKTSALVIRMLMSVRHRLSMFLAPILLAVFQKTATVLAGSTFCDCILQAAPLYSAS